MSSASSFNKNSDFGRRPKGAVIFTGPDGVSNYHVDVRDSSYVGHGSTSTEATSDTQHLYRAPKESPYPQAKSAKVGEVGWGVVKLMDGSLLKSGNQIMLKEFRQAVENRYTHRYQTPYYPPPTAHTVAPGPVALDDHTSAAQQSSKQGPMASVQHTAPFHTSSSAESSKISLQS